MEELFDWLYQQSFAGWCVIIFAGNALAAGFSILGCWLCSRAFQGKRIFEKAQPLTRSDVLLSIGAVILNSLVGVLGWLLWKQGWIEVTHASWPRVVLDTLLLLLVMDLAMYVFHWAAHYPPVYRLIHRSHHAHESTNPLSLFVLNPVEVLGFGGLLILALMVVPVSAAALMAYLFINYLCGTMGHLGVEPFPGRLMRLPLMRYVGTSTFHALHHAERRYNFGFYTTVWDRLFGTLHPEYDVRIQATVRPAGV